MEQERKIFQQQQQQQLESALNKILELSEINKTLAQHNKISNKVLQGQIQRYRILELKFENQTREGKKKTLEESNLLGAMEQKTQTLVFQLQQERAKKMKYSDENEVLKRQARDAIENEHQIKYQQIVQSSNLNELQDHVWLLKSMVDRQSCILNNTDNERTMNIQRIDALKLENSNLCKELQATKKLVQQRIVATNEIEQECSRLRTEMLKLAKQFSLKLSGTAIIATKATAGCRGRC